MWLWFLHFVMEFDFSLPLAWLNLYSITSNLVFSWPSLIVEFDFLLPFCILKLGVLITTSIVEFCLLANLPYVFQLNHYHLLYCVVSQAFRKNESNNSLLRFCLTISCCGVVAPSIIICHWGWWTTIIRFSLMHPRHHFLLTVRAVIGWILTFDWFIYAFNCSSHRQQLTHLSNLYSPSRNILILEEPTNKSYQVGDPQQALSLSH